MELGRFELCFKVSNLKISTDFYKALGFDSVRFEPETGISCLQRSDLKVTLYDRYISETLLNFRGADIMSVATKLKEKGLIFERDASIESDGSCGALLRDPDGNLIYLNTAPGEELNH